EAAAEGIELATANTGKHRRITLVCLQVLGGDVFVGVDLQVKAIALADRCRGIVAHDVVLVTGGADDVKHADSTLVGIGGHGKRKCHHDREYCKRSLQHDNSP